MRLVGVGVMVIVCVLPAIAAAEPDTNLADLYVLRETRVTVTHRSGEQVTGPLLTAAPDGLSLMVAGTPLTIPEADVRRITRKGDSLKNGALWGLAFGAAIGAASVATCETNCDGEFPAGAVMAIGSLYGVGLGTLVDWLIPGSTTVYRGRGTTAHVAPILRTGVVGVAVDLKFSKTQK